jgi:hypothetical protein
LSTVTRVAKGSVVTLLTPDFIVGCEVEAICDPGLEESTFVRLLGSEVGSIVRQQPTISQLVSQTMKAPNNSFAVPRNRELNGIPSDSPLRFIGQDLHFEHLSAGDTEGDPFQTQVSSQTGKRRRSNVDDGFTDIECDEIEFDEDDLRILSRVDFP